MKKVKEEIGWWFWMGKTGLLNEEIGWWLWRIGLFAVAISMAWGVIESFWITDRLLHEQVMQTQYLKGLFILIVLIDERLCKMENREHD